jgi:RHS repeat-associated protein
VYFDNLTININTGNIIEEDHYYSFGLKIAAISSHKLGDAGEGKLSNPYQYNDKEQLDEDAGLGWLDYGFREYDPEIGRFPQLDPLSDDLPILSPYQYAANDPIGNVDEDGLDALGVVGAIASGGTISSREARQLNRRL